MAKTDGYDHQLQRQLAKPNHAGSGLSICDVTRVFDTQPGFAGGCFHVCLHRYSTTKGGNEMSLVKLIS